MAVPARLWDSPGLGTTAGVEALSHPGWEKPLETNARPPLSHVPKCHHIHAGFKSLHLCHG